MEAFNNVIAISGTAFSRKQARELFKHTNTVYLAMDSDEAGQKATDKIIEVIQDYEKEFNGYLHSPNMDTRNYYAAVLFYKMGRRSDIINSIITRYESIEDGLL